MGSSVVKPMFYTRKQVSIMSGISVNNLQSMAVNGRGPRCFVPRDNKLVLYPRAEVDEWLQGKGGHCFVECMPLGEMQTNSRPKSAGRPSKKDQVARRKRAGA